MEEKLMLGLGFEAMSSSTLYLRGGATFWTDLFTKMKAMINFIADYVPKFMKGFAEGFGLSIFNK